MGEELLGLLDEARRLGFLGPGPVRDHVHHAAAFVSALEGLPPGRALDLGSGGGVPGLILALARPSWRWVLLDAGSRRAAFLQRAVEALDLGDRVAVVTGRAEEIGRHPAHRHHSELVVARSFAGPAVTAECAAPLLAVGGRLLVSEPPAGGDRWSEVGLHTLGLRRTSPARAPHLATFLQERRCPDRYPRRTGVPSKRPLW